MARINKFLCFDSETTGLCFNNYDPSIDPITGGIYQAISWGLIISDTAHYEPERELYVELKWDPNTIWTREAENIHGLSKDYLEEHGKTNEEAAEEIGTFLFETFSTDAIPIAGHRIPGFDFWFLKRFFEDNDIPFKIRQNFFLDLFPIGAVVLNAFSSNEIFDALGFPPRQKHNALEDARMTLEAMKMINSLLRP